MILKGIIRGGLLLAFAMTLGCGEEEEASKQANAGGGGRGGRPGGWGGRGGPGGRKAAIPVKGAKVTRADMSAYVETYARLEAERQVSVLARTTGLVEALRVEEGDRVRQGQILVQLNKEELDLRLRQSKAAFEEASANYERIKVLHEQRMVSQTEYETTRLRFANATLGLEETELNMTYADLRAPISGVITQRLVELGDLVRGNQEVFVIADLNPLLVRIFVPERRMYQLHPGQQATIAVEALPDKSFDGEIRMISPEVNPESGTVKVTLEIAANGLLKPGMFATVRIITARRPQTLIVPKKALILETDEDVVFLITEGKVQRVAVQLGFVEGDQVEVVSGLKEGDQVVTIGHEGLKDGAAVRLAGEGLAMAPGGGGPSGDAGKPGGWQGGQGSKPGAEGGGQGQPGAGGGKWQGGQGGQRGAGQQPGSHAPDSTAQVAQSTRPDSASPTAPNNKRGSQ